MKLKNIILFLLVCTLLSSCFVTRKQRAKICADCKTHTTEYIKDSIYIKDTVVNVEPDSASIEALLDCDSLGRVRIVEMLGLQGDVVKLEMALKNNRIRTKARIDTIKVYVPGKTEIHYKFKDRLTEKEVIKYKDYWWKWILIIWSALSALYFIVKYRNGIFSLIKSLI